MEDKNNGVVIERIFNAAPKLVYKAWTDPEMIKKWWGPEHFTAPSIETDLRIGGKYIFAMQGEPGSAWEAISYSAGEYKEIVPNKKLVVTDYFSDSEGNKVKPSTYGIGDDFPDEMTVTVLFEEVEGGKTKLSVVYPKPETEEQLEAMLKTQMKEGWQSSLNKLEAALI